MRSTNATESGTQSPKLYLVIQYNNRHDLLALPDAYSDLEAHVKRLYNLEKGGFYAETNGLNLCPDARVRIPEDAWADTIHLLQAANGNDSQAQDNGPRLLGNLFIVPRPIDSIDVEPERVLSNESFAPNKGHISLNEPFIGGKALFIQVARIDTTSTAPSSPKSTIQLLDQSAFPVLTITVFPASGWILLTTTDAESSFPDSLKRAFPFDAKSEHTIIVRKDGRRFLIFFDFDPFGSVGGSNHGPITSVAYGFGLQSPFKEPVTAAVFPNLLRCFEGSALYMSMFPRVDDETLFDKIVSCDGINATYISELLSVVRSGNGSPTGSEPFARISWQPYSQHAGWTDIKWDMHPKTMFFARFVRSQKASSGKGNSGVMQVSFGSGVRVEERGGYVTLQPMETNQQSVWSLMLRIKLDGNNVSVHDNLHDSDAKWLRTSPHFPREHTIVVIFKQNNIHFVYDFTHSYTVARTWTPEEVSFDVPTDDLIEAGVYGFSNVQ